jgi:NTE family protein
MACRIEAGTPERLDRRLSALWPRLRLLLRLIVSGPLCFSLAALPIDAQAPAGRPPASEEHASPPIPSLAPAPPPPGPANRPRIGLALGGGAAFGLSEIGVLQWLEDHHIPVDVMAGTSMGALVGSLYAIGRTPQQIKMSLNADVTNSVFLIDTNYKNRSFRRREDSRALPNALQVGLRHGVSLRNSVLTDQGLNAFLDREFYRYDDRVEFNDLPIPFRSVSTDLTDARTAIFVRGSLPDAVRASVSLPGVFGPLNIGGHEFVDGGVLQDLPTQTVREMKADVILAVSIPMQPIGSSGLKSILAVLDRSFAVAIDANERESQKLADVLIAPDVTGFNESDFVKSRELAERGYQAAERNKEALLKYAVSDALWAEYIAARNARVRGAAGNILRVLVQAPSPSTAAAVQKLFNPLAGRPMNTAAVESLLADIRSDGRYDADYRVTYDTPDNVANRPTLIVLVTDKETGPPFLELGANLAAQTGSAARATIEGILVDQDLGGYGSELRTHIKAGTLTEAGAEYYRRLAMPFAAAGARETLFAAPRFDLLRQPFYIYQGQVRLSERQLQSVGGGFDLGWSNQSTQELRAGWEMDSVRWNSEVGSGNDGLPDVYGSVQRARLRYVYDTQDRSLVPQFGAHFVLAGGYLYRAVTSPGGASEAPQITAQASLAHKLGNNVLLFTLDSGTMFNRDVAQPFRFTLGGPLRLSASAIDQYRGTDYFFLSPTFLRRIAALPAPLGQSVYLGGGYEAGQMRAPDASTITRQDVYFGLFAETPFGVITLTPAFGDDGYRKLTFTLGKLF